MFLCNRIYFLVARDQGDEQGEQALALLGRPQSPKFPRRRLAEQEKLNRSYLQACRIKRQRRAMEERI